jgi:carbon storage regulator
MLIIRRREGESILLGDNIRIEVIELSSSRVKLGFSAPDSVPILREEIYLAECANRAAAEAVNRDSIAMLAGLVRTLHTNSSGYSSPAGPHATPDT